MPKFVCNIQWRVGVINSIPTAVYTLSSRCTFDKWAGSVEEDAGDEHDGDRSAGNRHLVTSNRGRYRHLDLCTEFQNTTHPNEGLGSPLIDRHSSSPFPVHTVLFSNPQISKHLKFCKCGKTIGEATQNFPTNKTSTSHQFPRTIIVRKRRNSYAIPPTHCSQHASHALLPKSRESRAHTLCDGEIFECLIVF